MYPLVQLKQGKEANVVFRHPWIFSGAIERVPDDVQHGGLVRVADASGKVLGVGTYSASSSIAVRVCDFSDTVIDQPWFEERFRAADAQRLVIGYGPETLTTGYRVVFGEADGIPGLIVDRYADVIVFQIATAGMDRLREMIVAALKSSFSPRVIVERSDMGVRKEEKLENVVAIHVGEDPGVVEFSEYGIRFLADVMHGQKTGFFLDQKELRQQIGTFANGKSVLNVFPYSGAASIVALKNGAKSVHNVDSSESALELAKKHVELNQLDANTFTTEVADAFQFFSAQRKPAYDMVIIDPPALIKSKRDIEEGKKAYHFLNRAAMRLVNNNGIFITSSCSHFFTEDDLLWTLRRASVQAGVDLHVLRVVRQSPDHPQSVYFPESGYLKSVICLVRRPETQ